MVHIIKLQTLLMKLIIRSKVQLYILCIQITDVFIYGKVLILTAVLNDVIRS